MILKRLFKSPWRKKKPSSTSTATIAISPDAIQRLTEQATGDPDPGVRRLTCKQISDLTLLQRVADSDPDAGVRTVAAARLRNLLLGREAESPPLEQRIAYLEAHLDAATGMADALVLQGQEPKLRLTALSQVTDPTTLAECAVRDAVAAIRLAAVERLDDRPSLEWVVRSIGKKDKGVYRAARQRLKIIAEREQAPVRLRTEAEALCARVERFGRRGTWPQDKALLDLCTQQWMALQGEPPDDLVARFNTACTLFQQGYAAYQAEQQAQRDAAAAQTRLRTAKQALLTELEAMADERDPRQIETRLSDLENRWSALDSLPDSEELRQRHHYERLVQELRERATHLLQVQESEQRLRRRLERARQWLAQSTPLDAQQIRQWCTQGDRLVAMQPNTTVAQDYRDLVEQLQQHLERQLVHAQHKVQHLPERLETLERELEEGVLRQAAGLHQSIQADLKLIHGSGMARRQYEALEQRLHRLTPRLRELQSWCKWGTDQHRLEMCETMERLANEPPPALGALAEQVQALQEEWKQLDRSGPRVNEVLWRRFHQAADRAYERCHPYLEEQGRLREANRQAREALCQQIETFLDQVDWAQMDWKKAVRAEREVRAAWESIGPTDPRHRKALNRRYRTAMKRLDAPLAKERVRNHAFKKDLIAQAQAVADGPDVAQAIQEIKHLQGEWHTTVAGKRSQENALWQEFRKACDRVFERRREAHQAHRQELEANIESRRGLCEALEALIHTSVPQDLAQQVQHLQARWEPGWELDVSRQEALRLQRRWQQGLASVRQHIRTLEDTARREQIERLRAQAALCAELETVVADMAKDATPPSVADWQQRWDALPKVADPLWHTDLERRFNTALIALQDPAARAQFWSSQTANSRKRAALCLQLEVLAGVESPPEMAEKRLAFQVSRLAERLSQGAADPLDEAPQIERAWYACGPAPLAQAIPLEQRFERALHALSQTRPKVPDEDASQGWEDAS